jgi:BirA family transcriptional regulator, biotin operon repressor / biotin---[acetyl-CoA-carboxylase] ligase
MYRRIQKIHLEKITSTQLFAKTTYHDLGKDSLVCIIAEEQTDGKGTQGRDWYSPKNNLYFTIVFSLSSSFRYLANISQVISLSCVRSLQELHVKVSCRWPNDLVVSGKKIGGILTEIVPSKEHNMVFVGIGLNVNMTKEELQHIDQPATSLYCETKTLWNKETLLDDLLKNMSEDLLILEKDGFDHFKKPYLQYVLYLNEKVIVDNKGTQLSGTFIGIDKEGRLLLETEDKRKVVLSGSDRMLKR